MANLLTRNIPNTITCCNLISGCIATYHAFQGDAVSALAWIIIGAVFDFFDGMTARLLHVSSPIGKELDSLADDVTFGVAPATIVYSALVLLLPHRLQLLAFAAFLIAAFSALRLAKFNLDERQSMGFIGLPTPANALFWGSLVVCSPSWLMEQPWSVAAVLVLVVLSCWLLVSEVPMFALKFKHWGFRGNEVKYLFAAFSAVVITLYIIGNGAVGALMAWWPIIVMYVLVSVCSGRKPTGSKASDK